MLRNTETGFTRFYRMYKLNPVNPGNLVNLVIDLVYASALSTR